MDPFKIAALVLFVAFTLVTLWNFRPIPLSRNEVPDLRSQAAKMLMGSDKSERDKENGLTSIDLADEVEHLRLYARFIHLYDPADLRGIVERLRRNRQRLRTTLRSKNLTLEHIEVYVEFIEILSGMDCDDIHDEYKCKVSRKKRKDLNKLMIYSLNHIDKADDVLSVVRDRRVIQLRQAQQLLKDRMESPAVALSEGVL